MKAITRWELSGARSTLTVAVGLTLRSDYSFVDHDLGLLSVSGVDLLCPCLRTCLLGGERQDYAQGMWMPNLRVRHQPRLAPITDGQRTPLAAAREPVPFRTAGGITPYGGFVR